MDRQPIGSWNVLPSGFFRRFHGNRTAYVANNVGRGAWWWIEQSGRTIAEGPAINEARAMSAVQLLAMSVYDGT